MRIFVAFFAFSASSAVFASSALSAFSALFASSASSQPPRPTFRTEANFVRVDAYPTRDGQPVTDLAATEFELFEDGARQAIETFEHVSVPLPGPHSARVEPNSVRESQAAAADPRARVFVVFLDVYHVNFTGSHEIRRPLINLLDRLIGQDDLFAVMTPEMSATEIAFARRTTTIEGMLARYWTWGRRDAVVDRDPEERDYENCYPGDPAVADMIRRRREKRTLDALTDLVTHLRGVREERKAVLAVSGGWTLPRADDSLMPKARNGVAPGLPPIRVGIDGRLTTRDERSGNSDLYRCDTDRMRLAQLDLFQTFLDLLETANRSNATFYPINPHGLEAGATPAGMDWIDKRVDSLKTLADNTDGIAIVNTNNLTGAMPRIVNDLSSYYLLGYYSSNPKLDGSYRKISVRVKRPGVSVRARRGYRAATAAEVSAGRAAADAAPLVDAAITTAVGTLSRTAPLHVSAVASPDGSTMWIAGELELARAGESRRGGDAVILVSQANGATIGQAKASLPAGRRSFSTRIDGLSLSPGAYDVAVRLTAPDAAPLIESRKVEVGSGAGGALLFRRGALATQPFEPAADPKFRRNETLRVQVPVASSAAEATLRLLDRNGNALNVPVTARELDQDGAHWIVGELPLASLAAGDYLLSIEAAAAKAVRAFRIVQ